METLKAHKSLSRIVIFLAGLAGLAASFVADFALLLGLGYGSYSGQIAPLLILGTALASLILWIIALIKLQINHVLIFICSLVAPLILALLFT